MKKKLFAAAVIVASIFIISCGKDAETTTTTCTNTAISADSAALVNFAAANSIIATKDVTGMYYEVISTGTGTIAPSGTSIIEVAYKGTLLNGKVFDSTAAGAKSQPLLLNQLISGWQIGIPKIKAGGRIKLLIPSALAYGCRGAGALIPSNTPIYFDVTLISVQ